MNMEEVDPITGNFLSSVFSIIPGPEDLQGVTDSQYLNRIEAYDIKAVAQFFTSLPHVKLLHDSPANWHDWKLEYQTSRGKITFNLMHDTNGTAEKIQWGGSNMTTNCSFSELIDFWLLIKSTFPFVYFHDTDCNIYTLETFIIEYAIPMLEEKQDISKSINLNDQISKLKRLMSRL